VSEYWEKVTKYWTESIDAARAGELDESAQLRRRRLPLPMPFATIAVTGIRGCGKSVIYDALTGRIGKNLSA
jgi:predicted AAA+ superfamily ATPase